MSKYLYTHPDEPAWTAILEVPFGYSPPEILRVPVSGTRDVDQGHRLFHLEGQVADWQQDLGFEVEVPQSFEDGPKTWSSVEEMEGSDDKDVEPQNGEGRHVLSGGEAAVEILRLLLGSENENVRLRAAELILSHAPRGGS